MGSEAAKHGGKDAVKVGAGAAETVLSFELRSPVTVHEKNNDAIQKGASRAAGYLGEIFRFEK